MRLAIILERVSTAIERVAGLFLAAVTLIVFFSAISRYLFSLPIPDAFDVSRYILGIVVMWGFACVGYHGSHIKVDLVADMLPRRIRRVIDAVAWLVLLLFTILLAWKMFHRVDSAYASGEASFDLRMPAWPFLGLIWLGVVASIVTISSRIIITLADPELELSHHRGGIDAADGNGRR